MAEITEADLDAVMHEENDFFLEAQLFRTMTAVNYKSPKPPSLSERAVGVAGMGEFWGAWRYMPQLTQSCGELG
ncbi:hypothetical protein SKAU_G00399230 [Synaphobranchus kaupii]|uniref:Uncharacterized protein n=1 Tax=Synaphobranchus kaupii TaxID=118154 RepID=A0A9Q1E8Q1_SYNKA|nr:hypothetical protein SKAU_G00399230 [Synaphobranchus kaupii]